MPGSIYRVSATPILNLKSRSFVSFFLCLFVLWVELLCPIKMQRVENSQDNLEEEGSENLSYQISRFIMVLQDSIVLVQEKKNRTVTRNKFIPTGRDA